MEKYISFSILQVERRRLIGSYFMPNEYIRVILINFIIFHLTWKKIKQSICIIQLISENSKYKTFDFFLFAYTLIMNLYINN